MSDCIEWQGALDKDGYGKISRAVPDRKAHRVAYCAHHGVSPTDIRGQVVRHTCDNRRCVNGKHLLLGTQADNMRDRADRDRYHKAIPQIRKFSDEVAAWVRSVYVPRSRETGAAALAKQFGVSRSTIRDIVNGTTYYTPSFEKN